MRVTKIGLRKLWFQVHKWIGLILAILIIPVSLTGSALVWHDPLERIVSPARFATSGTDTLDPIVYAEAAAKALKPGERIATLRMPEEPGDPVIVSAAQVGGGARPGPPVRTNIYLDPPTARVLEVSGSRSGLVMAFHMLHGSLMLPGMGRQIVGWIGVAMAVSCFTGIWLWWPMVGRWTRGLRWKRQPNLDGNLHHLLGFWIAIPLFVLSFTGAWISFPQVFSVFDGAARRGPGPDRAAMMRARPLAAPATSVGDAIARASELAPGKIASITWPTDLQAEWSIGVAAKGPPATVTVADADGAAKLAPRPERPQRQTLARTMRQIHDGNGLPFVWQLIIFVGGIIPAVLAVTGIIMWWRARGWRAKLAQRQKQKAAAAE